MRTLHRFLVPLSLILLLLTVPQAAALHLVTQKLTVNGHTVELQLPPDLQIEFLASLSQPRLMSLGPNGEILIGSRGPHIYRLGSPFSQVETLVTLSGNNQSVAYRDGRLYVAETAGLYSAPYSGETPAPADFSLTTPLPSATGGHSSRTVVLGPDNRLYVSLGISGNCSDEYVHNSYPFELRRGGVFVLDETGPQVRLQPYSSGLRNPIGLAFHPSTHVLYATNAGPDNLGYYQPPEIFTPLSQGSFHGMPWFQYMNGDFKNGECASSPPPRPKDEATAPSALFAARSTPIGLTFIQDSHLGQEFTGNSFVAIHGSWARPPGGNSSSRRPPKIVMVTFENNIPRSVEDIVTGFQRPDGSRFARPAGVLMGHDGNLYFTSDGGDVEGLFRLSPRSSSQINSDSISSIYLLFLR